MRPVTVGVTGDKKGMTPVQAGLVALALRRARELGATKFVHGCCIGVDEEAARLARELGYKIVGLPGSYLGDPDRSFDVPDVLFAVRPPLERNRLIVKNADLLLACPSGSKELRRSGTWATVRYRRKARTPLVLLPGDLAVPSRSLAMLDVLLEPAGTPKIFSS